MDLTCPKCGFLQNGGEECLRCGLIFARHKKCNVPAGKPETIARADTGRILLRAWLKRGCLVFRWLSLGVVLLVAMLVLKQPPRPEIDTAPQAMEQAELKLHRFQREVSLGRPDRLSWNEAELNAWLRANLAVADAPSAKDSEIDDFAGESELSAEEVQSAVRDVRIDLFADRLCAYVTLNFYGKDLSLLLEGRISTINGYLRLTPTRGMLGSLPLPQRTLESAVRRLFESPENREKFRLPASIEKVAIEEGQFVISGRVTANSR